MTEQLRPRDIQARIRAGASVEELAAGSDTTVALIERFAGPVLAERAHIASSAMTSTVRRTGESTSHRHLRLAVTDRLTAAGVDPDTVDWDAYRLPDGRWAVTAAYVVAEESRTAGFVFTPAGRFSVAADDEARALLGEKPWAPLGERDPDDEPTIDLADELALVRAVQPEPAPAEQPAAADPSDHSDQDPEDEPSADASATGSTDDAQVGTDEGGPDEDGAAIAPVTDQTGAESGDDDRSRRIDALELGEDDSGSQLDRLFAMMGTDETATEPVSDTHDGAPTDEPADQPEIVEASAAPEARPEVAPEPKPRSRRRRTSGASDAAAVPETTSETWAPAEPYDLSSTPPTVPLEPSLFDDEPQFAPPAPESTEGGSTTGSADDSASAGPNARRRSRRRTAVPPLDEPADEPAADPPPDQPPVPELAQAADRPDGPTDPGDSDDPAVAVHEPPAADGPDATTDRTEATDRDDPPPAAEKPRKRKGRASVPSWDEIMFGSPRRR